MKGLTIILALALAAPAQAAQSHVEKIFHAAARPDPSRLEALLAEGFDPAALYDGESPLRMAAWHGRVEAIGLLLAAGVDVNVRTAKSKNTPLQSAARGGRHDAALALLAAGADVNIGNRIGRTALHRAAQYADAAMIDLLLDAGADPLARLGQLPGDRHTDTGSTPYEIARKYNPRVLETEAGRRLAALTLAGTGCEGAIVTAGDTKLSLLAERTLGKASRWKEIAELNNLGAGKSYRKGDCLALP